MREHDKIRPGRNNCQRRFGVVRIIITTSNRHCLAPHDAGATGRAYNTVFFITRVRGRSTTSANNCTALGSKSRFRRLHVRNVLLPRLNSLNGGSNGIY